MCINRYIYIYICIYLWQFSKNWETLTYPYILRSFLQEPLQKQGNLRLETPGRQCIQGSDMQSRVRAPRLGFRVYSPPEVDKIWLWVYCNKIPIYPIFHLLKGTIGSYLKQASKSRHGSFPRIGGPQYRPQHTIVLIIGTPKIVPLILGNPHIVHVVPCTTISSRFCQTRTRRKIRSSCADLQHKLGCC